MHYIRLEPVGTLIAGHPPAGPLCAEAAGRKEVDYAEEFRGLSEAWQGKRGHLHEAVRHRVEGLQAIATEFADYSKKSFEHGTATLEETAYFLHLALKTDKTVVVVGDKVYVTREEAEA